MAQHALIDERTTPHRVVNLIEIEDGARWAPPAGHRLVRTEQASIGDEHTDGVFVAPRQPPPPPPPPAPARWLVDKLAIVDRLVAAGRFDAAMAALDASPRLLRERWNAATQVYSDDPDAVALLGRIGADPVEILAP